MIRRPIMKKLILTGLMAVFICFMCAACGGNDGMIHVSPDGNDKTGDGSSGNPYATVSAAVSKAADGDEVIVHEGTYDSIVLKKNASGTRENPMAIKAADGEKAVIKSSGYGIHMVNADNITIDGFEIEGGTHGIYYESTEKQGKDPLENVTISNCTVHGIWGTHGICVYARNSLAPVKNLTMEGCHVYDCRCGSSESTVFNGNIDGFTISGNVIHDNNNIGIDMIGFEGTADVPEKDCARNGVCRGNVVYNISARGNEAYLEDGEYDLCADGIYVDGGQDIEIYENFVFNCDIGIEVATEHSPDDNSLFRVSRIKVHDNVIAACTGWCGLCFGGYDKDLGFTEESEFYSNTFVDNGTQIGVQRSKGNQIYDNLFAGGDSAVEFNSDCRQKDMVNVFGENTWCLEEGVKLEDAVDFYGLDPEVLFPEKAMKKQTVISGRDKALDGFKSLIDGAGSAFVPEDKYVEIYEKEVNGK